MILINLIGLIGLEWSRDMISFIPRVVMKEIFALYFSIPFLHTQSLSTCRPQLGRSLTLARLHWLSIHRRPNEQGSLAPLPHFTQRSTPPPLRRLLIILIPPLPPFPRPTSFRRTFRFNPRNPHDTPSTSCPSSILPTCRRKYE